MKKRKWYIFTGCIPITNIFHNNKTWHVEKYIYCNKKEVGGTTNDYIVIFYTYPTTLYLVYHSSQIQRLCLTKKLPVKCFQNLSCFIYFKNIRQKFWIYLLKFCVKYRKPNWEEWNTEHWTWDSLYSLTIFSFCLLQKCPWKPYHIYYFVTCRGKPEKLLIFFAANENEWRKKTPPSHHHDWRFCDT